jgi:hypothetical protein
MAIGGLCSEGVHTKACIPRRMGLREHLLRTILNWARDSQSSGPKVIPGLSQPPCLTLFDLVRVDSCTISF